MGIGWERVILKGASFRLAVIVENLRWQDEQVHLASLLLLSRERAEELRTGRIGAKLMLVYERRA